MHGGWQLIPQRLVPILALRIRQIILLEVHGRIEHDLGRVTTVLRPVDFIIWPHGVGVAGVHEREQVFLHFPLHVISIC